MNKLDQTKCCWTCKHACWKDCLTPTGRFAKNGRSGECNYPVPEVPELPWSIKANIEQTYGKNNNPFSHKYGISPDTGADCVCYEPTKAFSESGIYTIYEITKEFRGGRTIYSALLEEGLKITGSNRQQQLEQWGEETGGGHESGYSINMKEVDKIPTRINGAGETREVCQLDFDPRYECFEQESPRSLVVG